LRHKVKFWLIPLHYQLGLRRVEHKFDFFDRQGFLNEAELHASVTWCRSIVRQREMHQRDREQERERNADLQAPHDLRSITATELHRLYIYGGTSAPVTLITRTGFRP